jgi:hypothetical protein
VTEAAGGGVAIHAGAYPVEQDRPAGPVADRAVDGPTDRRWQGHQYDLGALAAYPQYSMPMLLAQVIDVGPAGFEDS